MGIPRRCALPVASRARCDVSLPDVCPPDEYCDRTVPGAFACMPLPADGAPCLSALYPLRCSGRLYCGSDVICHDLQPNGGGCNGSAVCASQRCVSNACTAPALCAP